MKHHGADPLVKRTGECKYSKEQSAAAMLSSHASMIKTFTAATSRNCFVMRLICVFFPVNLPWSLPPPTVLCMLLSMSSSSNSPAYIMTGMASFLRYQLQINVEKRGVFLFWNNVWCSLLRSRFLGCHETLAWHPKKRLRRRLCLMQLWAIIDYLKLDIIG